MLHGSAGWWVGSSNDWVLKKKPRVDITLTNNTDHYVNFGERFMPTLKIDGVRHHR